MKNCPVCNSNKFRKNQLTGDSRCDNCGYEYKMKLRSKEIFSKTGGIRENEVYGK